MHLQAGVSVHPLVLMAEQEVQLLGARHKESARVQSMSVMWFYRVEMCLQQLDGKDIGIVVCQ